jgi:hypothetical protein
MPDLAAIAMMDQSPRPALSATSDMPVITPPEPAAEPASPPEPAAAAAEPAETTPAPEAPVEGEPPAKPAKTGVQERFSELTAKRKEAEARAAEAESQRLAREAELAEARAELERLKNPPKTENEPEPNPRPKRADFNDPDAYDEAVILWATGNAAAAIPRQLAEQRAAALEQQRKAATDAQARATNEAWQAKVETFKSEKPDFEDVALSKDVAVTPIMGNMILNAENGPAMAYYLGQNPAEAARIAALPPPRQAIEMGRISIKLETPPPVSKAPPPIKPVGQRNAATEKSPSEMTMEEYSAWRTKQNGGRPIR